MNRSALQLKLQTRRRILRDCGIGLGQVALLSLLSPVLHHANAPDTIEPIKRFGGLASLPHFVPKAKRVIYLFMAGAPSQLELFDYKPRLTELEGSPIPPSVIQGQRYAFIQSNANVLGPQFKFAKHGESGIELSEMLPHLSKVVDELCLIRSVHTEQFNHAPAQLFVNSGSGLPGRPALGAWLSYGIGNGADDLPAFVVLKSDGSISGGAAMWSSGFLPSQHQGVPFRSQGDPILHVANPPGFDQKMQRDSLDLIAGLNRQRLDVIHDPEISARIDAYELAFRMQMRAPELMDLSQESSETLALYGASGDGSGNAFANQCLLARRLAERGVRFIQIYSAGWDHHTQVKNGVRSQAQVTDQASAALLIDLKRRGMLKDTLVIWGGEFGRTPMVEASVALGREQGRDHHPQAFTVWMAGGGIRAGHVHGATDEFGFHPTVDPVHIHDLQATILHCLGIDHRRLTYYHQGLDFRLTGVEEHQPILKILA